MKPLHEIKALPITGAEPMSLTVVTPPRGAVELDLTTDGAQWEQVPLPSGTGFGQASVKGKMKILIYTPEHPSYGIRPQTRCSIQAAIKNYDGPVDWLISTGDNPVNAAYDNVAYHHNKARSIILAGNYDAFLSIESDMIVPVDTIVGLIATDSDIAYGLYIWRHKPFRWNAYKTLNLWGGESVTYHYNGNDARASWDRIIDVAGLGMGCTLIRRNVLEELEFRLHDGTHSWIVDEYREQFETLGIDPHKERRHMVCDDWLLAMDAQHYGYSQRCNLSIVCGHIDHQYVLWPDLDSKNFYRKDMVKEI